MYADHDHRGQYAEDRHDHDGDYAEKYHRHFDDESTARGLREDLGRAEARISGLEERVGELEGDQAGMLAQLRVLDRLRPTCVLCHDQAADRQTVNGPACSDCLGDLPDDEPEPAPYDPGPEVDDEGGMSEHRYLVAPDDYSGWGGVQ